MIEKWYPGSIPNITIVAKRAAHYNFGNRPKRMAEIGVVAKKTGLKVLFTKVFGTG